MISRGKNRGLGFEVPRFQGFKGKENIERELTKGELKNSEYLGTEFNYQHTKLLTIDTVSE